MEGPESKLTLDFLFYFISFLFKNDGTSNFIFLHLVYFDVDSVIVPIGFVATLEFNFGPFQGSIDAIN